MRLLRSLKCAVPHSACSSSSRRPVRRSFAVRLYVSGLTHPVAFVQDPSNAGVQFVVERAGVIRVVQGGTLLSTPFLDLSGAVGSGGERGLLSLAFPPGAAESGRFFVTFVNTRRQHRRRRGSTARRRSARRRSGDAIRSAVVDRRSVHPASRDRFTTAATWCSAPTAISTSGPATAASPTTRRTRPRTSSKLHGKMLRINVNVGDGDPEGFDIPADNPFVGGAPRPRSGRSGFGIPGGSASTTRSGAAPARSLIADVGENAFEEINYEPAGRGGRNYGWRNREGANIHETSLPPAFEPLTDPIFDYDHGTGRSITGGYVYRGARIPSMVGPLCLRRFRARTHLVARAHARSEDRRRDRLRPARAHRAKSARAPPSGRSARSASTPPASSTS